MSRIALGWLAVLVLSCGAKDEGVGADADTDTDTDADTDTDTDTDITGGTPGIETRPPNPTCVAPEPPVSPGQAVLSRAFPSLPTFSLATAMIQAPGDGDHWTVLTQDGRVWRFDDDPAASTAPVVLDIRSEVLDGGELGLLGIAFHPDFQANGHVFLSYTSDGIVSRITRFTSTDGGASLDPTSRVVFLEVDQPYTNHKGGWIEFGPDGFLYAGFGDGGSADDPGQRAQDPDELLGKFLRIDVDNPSGGNEYGIPADNPYASGGGRPEIFAIGLRNPYRWHFDPESEALYAGDVGQNAAEEVNIIALGGNYGWDIMEADLCHEPAVGCDRTALILPLASYPHAGSQSVIGGVVYHGDAIASLKGVYLYSDFYDLTVWGLTHDPVTGAYVAYKVISNAGQAISHWVTGDDGEVYALDYTDGIFKLEAASVVVDTFPEVLSATGCVEAADPWTPNPGMVPYDLNHPFWSDGAQKGRWMAIPDGTTIAVDGDGDWDFPIGTVLLKRFEKDGVRIETRLMMRHPDGSWAGYSYVWRADGTDADLADGAVAIDLPSQTWTVPGRAECVQCHTVAAGGSLGLEDRQMNRTLTYPSGVEARQISTLDYIGWFTVPPGDPGVLGEFPAIDDDSASIEDRARAYLHVNCSQCHQPDGPTPSDMDLRHDTALADMAVCGEPTAGTLDLGADARIIAAGDPSNSVLSERMRRRDTTAMPPTGSALVDEVGAGVIDAWISGLATCP